MSLQADLKEDWLLRTNDVKLRTIKHVEHNIEEKKVRGWLEQADHGIITQTRAFFGLIRHDPATGDETTSFSWYVGNGRTHSFSRVGKIDPTSKYICTGDRIEIDDSIIGSGVQTQTWELQSKFEPIAGSYFEEEVKDE